MANKWRDVPTYGRAMPFICHCHVVFDVPVLNLNLPIQFRVKRRNNQTIMA